MALTVKAIEAFEPAEKMYKKFDGSGLYVAVYPSGTKVFRLKYWNQCKEQLVTFGKFGEISLAKARQKADSFRQNLSKPDNGSSQQTQTLEVQLAKKGEDFLFGEISELWLLKRFKRRTIKYRKSVQGILEQHILPIFGERYISTIRVKELYDFLCTVQDKGLVETGVRARSIIDRIYRFAATQGYEGNYPCPMLKGQLDVAEARSMPAPTDEFQLQSVLQRLSAGNRASNVVMLAISCSFHWFCRPIELRTLQWTNVNYRLNRLELISAKSYKPHLIPLTKQTLDMLEHLKMLSGDSPYIFQSPTKQDQPISENSCNQALRRLGISNDELVMHGVRATAMTLLRDRFNIDRDVIRTQLAHSLRDKTQKAYDRSRYLRERLKMMKNWSQFLEDLVAGKVDLTDLIGEI